VGAWAASSRSLKRHHIAAAAAVASVFLFSFDAVSPALAAKKDNSVVFAAEQVPQNVDVYFNNLVIGSVIGRSGVGHMIYRDPDTGEFKGNLATAWRWLNDTTLELDLRPGVKFHNGAGFDADDVASTLTLSPSRRTRSCRHCAVGRARSINSNRYKVRIS